MKNIKIITIFLLFSSIFHFSQNNLYDKSEKPFVNRFESSNESNSLKNPFEQTSSPPLPNSIGGDGPGSPQQVNIDSNIIYLGLISLALIIYFGYLLIRNKEKK